MPCIITNKQKFSIKRVQDVRFIDHWLRPAFSSSVFSHYSTRCTRARSRIFRSRKVASTLSTCFISWRFSVRTYSTSVIGLFFHSLCLSTCRFSNLSVGPDYFFIQPIYFLIQPTQFSILSKRSLVQKCRSSRLLLNPVKNYYDIWPITLIYSTKMIGSIFLSLTPHFYVYNVKINVHDINLNLRLKIDYFISKERLHRFKCSPFKSIKQLCSTGNQQSLQYLWMSQKSQTAPNYEIPLYHTCRMMLIMMIMKQQSSLPKNQILHSVYNSQYERSIAYQLIQEKFCKEGGRDWTFKLARRSYLLYSWMEELLKQQMGEDTSRVPSLSLHITQALTFIMISLCREVEKRFDQLRDSLNIPQIINRFMKHMLITLIISTIVFIVAILLQNDEGILIASCIFMLWSFVYCAWAIVLLKEMRTKIRKGFLEIEKSLPELQFKFSQLCEGCCECCIRQDYIEVYANN